jgi:hypothetical protein
MTKHNHIAKITALAIALGAALPAFAQADEVVVDGNGTHHYVFYKDHDIYFSPENKVYYWNDGRRWQSAAVLPSEQQRYVSSGGVDIALDTTRPYERNDYVMSRYKDHARNSHAHEFGRLDHDHDDHHHATQLRVLR